MSATFGGACAQFLSAEQSTSADNFAYDRHCCSERNSRTSPNSNGDDHSRAPDPTDAIAHVVPRPKLSRISCQVTACCGPR